MATRSDLDEKEIAAVKTCLFLLLHACVLPVTCCTDCQHFTTTIKKDGAHFTSFARIANLYLKAVEAALEQLQQKNPQVTEKQVHVEPVPHSVVTRVALADFEDLPGDWRNHLQDQHSHPAAE